jgi:hypothetical protein
MIEIDFDGLVQLLRMVATLSLLNDAPSASFNRLANAVKRYEHDPSEENSARVRNAWRRLSEPEQRCVAELARVCMHAGEDKALVNLLGAP